MAPAAANDSDTSNASASDCDSNSSYDSCLCPALPPPPSLPLPPPLPRSAVIHSFVAEAPIYRSSSSSSSSRRSRMSRLVAPQCPHGDDVKREIALQATQAPSQPASQWRCA